METGWTYKRILNLHNSTLFWIKVIQIEVLLYFAGIPHCVEQQIRVAPQTGECTEGAAGSKE